jgi:hypothetical protein|tara:strand:- start:877 stop:1095 length:219 start_codon:yes stop_codon:yes gene_type:complete
MTEKYPGFFTAIFGGRKAKEPEPVKPKRKPKKTAQKKSEPPQELPKETASEEPAYMRHTHEFMKEKESEENE